MPNPTLKELKIVVDKIKELYPKEAEYPPDSLEGVIFLGITNNLEGRHFEGVDIPDNAIPVGIANYVSGNIPGFGAIFTSLIERHPELVRPMFTAIMRKLNSYRKIDRKVFDILKSHLFLHDIMHNSKLRDKLIGQTNAESPEQLFEFIKKMMTNDINDMTLDEEDESDKYKF